MKYYYLSKENLLCGPHTFEELQTFLENGEIDSEVMVAVAGDRNWKRFSDVIKQLDCSMWNSDTNACLYCKRDVGDREVPEKCPHCNRWIHGAGRGLWWTFFYALKNIFNYKGRATRKEYWGFIFISYLVYLILDCVFSIYISCFTNSDTAYSVDFFELECIDALKVYPGMLILCILLIVIEALICLAQVSLTVRRLHDTGRNTTCFLMWFLSLVGFVVLIVVSSLTLLEKSFEDSLLLINTNIEQNYTLALTFILFVIHVCISIYMFILMLIPGDRSANRYGPSINII